MVDDEQRTISERYGAQREAFSSMIPDIGHGRSRHDINVGLGIPAPNPTTPREPVRADARRNPFSLRATGSALRKEGGLWLSLSKYVESIFGLSRRWGLVRSPQQRLSASRQI